MKKLIKTLLILISLCFSAQAQIITTVVGNGSNCTFNGDSILATSACLSQVRQVAIDDNDNLYYGEYSMPSRIRKVDKLTGLVSTLAGGGSSYADSIQGASTQVLTPSGIALDTLGNVYWSSGPSANILVRKVNQNTGIVTTYVGTNVQDCSGDSALALNQSLGSAWGLTIDSSESLYIADVVCGKIRKVNLSTDIIKTVVYDGAWNVITDSIGNIYFSGQNVIKKLSIATGDVTIIAGTYTEGYNGDNILATDALLFFPLGMAFDKVGNLYFADRDNYRVRRVDKITGIITTVAGNGIQGYNGDYILATSASLNYPQNVAFDSAGDLYICDLFRIRKVLMGSTSTNETKNAMSISLYPNPTSSSVTITLNGKKIKDIQVENLLGKTIYQSAIDEFKTTIDLSKESKGIYFVKITDYNNYYSLQKIVLE